MGALTTTSVVTPPVTTFFSRKLLMRALPFLAFSKVAQRRPLGLREGNIMKFRRYTSLALATTPLQEGIPPQGKQLQFTDITAQLAQYGDYIPITDLVEAIMAHPLLNEATKLLGEQSGQTLDALLRDIACAGTVVLYGGTATSRATLTTTTHMVDKAVIEKAVRTLSKANAMRFTEMIRAGVNVSTFPIKPAYWGVVDPDIEYTLNGLDGFIPVEKYANQSNVVEGEIGALKNVRFLMTTQNKIFLGGGGTAVGAVQSTGGLADVHCITIFGEEAIGVVPLESKNLENIIKPIGSAGAGDPLNQVGTSGWKHTGARVRLNEAFMVRIEVTVGS